MCPPLPLQLPPPPPTTQCSMAVNDTGSLDKFFPRLMLSSGKPTPVKLCTVLYINRAAVFAYTVYLPLCQKNCKLTTEYCAVGHSLNSLTMLYFLFLKLQYCNICTVCTRTVYCNYVL